MTTPDEMRQYVLKALQLLVCRSLFVDSSRLQIQTCIIIIIIVAWSRTVAPLRDLWQPQQTIALTGGFQHLRELDPPRYVEVGLDDDSSSDPVSCLLLCRLPVAVQRLQGLLDRAVRCGRKWTGAGVSGID